MIRFLFWNVCGVASSQQRKQGGIRPLLPSDKRYRNLRRILTVFCVRENIDVLVLAESPFEGQIYLPGFAEAKTTLRANAKTGCRLEIYHRSTVAVTSTTVVERAVLHGLRAKSNQQDFLLVSAHLASPLSLTPESRKEKLRDFVSDIHNGERMSRSARTVLVGDLNYNPQDAPITDAHFLNAVPTKAVAKNKTRVLSRSPKIEKLYFYNPMWAHLTDKTGGPPGTYYYNTKDVDCRFWYIPDQVLVRPDLLDFWDDENLQIVSSIGKMSLSYKNGVPNRKKFSDHFPITFSLNL